MEYIRQMNAFGMKSLGILDPNAITLYLRLFLKANQNNWKDEWISVTNEWLMCATGIGSHHTISSARNSLKENGFIDFIPGGKHRPTKYKLIPLTTCASTPSNYQASTKAGDEALIQAETKAEMPQSDIQAENRAAAVYNF